MSNVIVVDTSVFVSALIGIKGPSREIVRRCLTGQYEPLISNALFREMEDVCRRTRVKQKCPLDKAEIRELLNAYYHVCKWMPIYYLCRPNIPDEDDNFLIELALAGNASHIVTNNISDLTHSELAFPELKIVKPEKMLRGE